MARIREETKDRPFLGMTLFDVWPLKSPEWDNVPLLSWTPIDHSPVTPEVLQFFRRGGRKWAVAMSRFGETELLNAGLPRDQVYATTDQLLLQGTMRFDSVAHTLGSTSEVGPVIALRSAAS